VEDLLSRLVSTLTKLVIEVIERFFKRKDIDMDCNFEFDKDLRKWKFMLVLPLEGSIPDYREVKARLSEILGDMDGDKPYFKYTNLKELSGREK